MDRLAHADAMAFWISEKIPNDQFLLYAFDDPRTPIAAIAADLRARARGIADLRQRIVEVPWDLDRPAWGPAPVDDAQVVVHSGRNEHDDDWARCLRSVGSLIDRQVDPRHAAWCLHLWERVVGVPGSSGPATIAVLQISHALADGRRAAEIARALFRSESASAASGLAASGPATSGSAASGSAASSSPAQPPRWPEWTAPALLAARGLVRLPGDVLGMCRSGVEAWHASRDEPPAHDTGVPVSALNRGSSGQRELSRERELRVLVLDRPAFGSGHSATVSALCAIGIALEKLLGEETKPAVELTVGDEGADRARESGARNTFRNVGIGLHTDIGDLGARLDAIAADVDAARHAPVTRLKAAQKRAEESTPAFLSRWGVRGFDTDARPERVTGVTVLSSVHRGASDLELGGGRVLFTSGFPALSPAQGMTHGLNGIGNGDDAVIALSVTACPGVLPQRTVRDLDDYVASLGEALELIARVSLPARVNRLGSRSASPPSGATV